MPLSRDIGLHDLTIRQLHSRDLPLGRVRLLRLANNKLRDDPLLLAVILQQRRLADSALDSRFASCGLVQRGGRYRRGMELAESGKLRAESRLQQRIGE